MFLLYYIRSVPQPFPLLMYQSDRWLDKALQVFIEKYPELFIMPTTELCDAQFCPYRSLYSFREEDADFFFGREDFTERLQQRIDKQPIVVMLGASGSGKSSVVFAGLIPRLRKTEKWTITHFRPGDDPFGRLAEALLPLYENEQSETEQALTIRKLANGFSKKELPLSDVVRRIHKKILDRHLLIVVDQFEELYTLSNDDKSNVAQLFLDLLLEAVNAFSSVPVHFVLTLRADFMNHAMSSRLFDNERRGIDEKLGRMTRYQLMDAIVEPARKSCVQFEPGLVNRILYDVGDEPGNLPLLEFALTELWGRRQDSKLTHVGYDAIKQVQGALTHYADQVYGDMLSAIQREQARRVFVQLVHPGAGTEDTRRIATLNNIRTEDWTIIKVLADKRLIVTNQNKRGEIEVEVVHEALIRNWALLREWMQKDRIFRVWQEQLRVRLKRWQDSEENQEELLRGRLLAEAEEWLKERELDLVSEEKIYIKASLEQYRKSRKIALIKNLTIFLFLLTLPLASYAFYQWQRAIVARAQTEIARQETDNLRLALDATNQHENNHELALLLAIEATDDANLRQTISSLNPFAMWLFQSADLETRDSVGILQTNSALRNSLLQQGQTIALLTPHTEGVKQVIWNPRMDYAVTVSQKQVFVWNTATWELVNTIVTPRNIQHISWSPDGKYIAIATIGEGDTVQIWEAMGATPCAILTHTNTVNHLAWNRDGTRLATAGDNRKVLVWDMTPRQPTPSFSLDHQSSVRFVAWNRDDSQIMTISQQITYVWDVGKNTSSPRLVLANEGRLVNLAAWDTSETSVLTIENMVGGGTQSNYIYVWDSQTGERLKALPHSAMITSALWSQDGEEILTAMEDGTAMIWDVEREKVERIFAGHKQGITGVIWNDDETQIMTSSRDGTVRVWNTVSGVEIIKLTGHQMGVNQAIWNPNQTQAVSVSDDNTVRVWNLLPGEELPTLIGHQSRITFVAWNNEGTQLVTASEDRTAQIWDATTGATLHILPGHRGIVNQAVWSPDGNYIVTVSNENAIRFWDAHTGALLATETGHIGFVNQAHWYQHDDALWVVTASEDQTARVWKFNPPHNVSLMHSLEIIGPVNQAVWNHTGTQIAMAAFGTDKLVYIWDAMTGEQLLGMAGHGDNIGCADWNVDDTKLVTASDDTMARIWDTTTGEQIAVLAGHTSIVNQATWQPGGEWVLTASDDRTAIIWDTQAATP